jgi:nitrite reductase/ring-hydroxylating ferredoxin subunit
MTGTQAASKPRKLTASQLEAILALPEHDEARVPTGETLRPAQIYTDTGHFELERTRLLRRVPLPLTASCLLPERKMSAVNSDFGFPILLTRDGDGVLHAFLNACTHRGAMVAQNQSPEKCARLTCPYHAWTYGLDGRLLAVPRAETFPTLDKAEYGLRRLPACEAGGIVWIGLDPDHPVDFSLVQGQIADDFEAFGIPGMHYYGSRSFDLAANWKIIIETFLETYHVPPVHKETVAPHFAPVPTLITMFGPHSRQTTGRAHFTREQLDLDIDLLHRHVTHAYQLFPTGVLVTSPYHMNFITVFPRAANRTIAVCHMLTPKAPDTEKLRELYQRTITFNFETVFGGEDFRAAQLAQAGLETGALETVRFGGLEEALTEFHASIDKELIT